MMPATRTQQVNCRARAGTSRIHGLFPRSRTNRMTDTLCPALGTALGAPAENGPAAHAL
jgi:hypothetical protein